MRKSKAERRTLLRLRVPRAAILMSACFVLATAAFAGPQKSGAKTSDNELRRKNQATIEKYFTLSFVAGVDLFTEDGWYDTNAYAVQAATAVGEDEKNNVKQGVMKGKAALLADAIFDTRSFPDWKYSTLKIYSTQDPNLFFVEAAGSGTFFRNGNPAATPRKYSNTYIDVLTMHEGKIKSFVEHVDQQLNLLKALGLHVSADCAPATPQEKPQ
jgi:hypothetical protein